MRAPFPSTTLRVNFKLRVTLLQAQSERIYSTPPLMVSLSNLVSGDTSSPEGKGAG